MSVNAHVEAIFVAEGATRPLRRVDAAEAVAGRGLAGDRYELGVGTYSAKHGPDRHVTLISAEDLEALSDEGWPLAPGEHRRNVVVRGVDLPALEGREFAIGDVRLRSIRPCPPCGHLERVTGRPGLRSALEGRAGIRVEIVSGGTIRVGDAVLV
jgi:MOSC domain-containing protein YiiM